MTIYQSKSDWEVACSYCGAGVGQPCRTKGGDIAKYMHRASRETHLIATGRVKLCALASAAAAFPTNLPHPPQKRHGYTITVQFDDPNEASRAYDAIEKLLGEMGQIGFLSAAEDKA